MSAPIILSLFPGIGMLDSGFDRHGAIILRGPDIITGQDIRTWHAPHGIAQGIIGGSPCQDFSDVRRNAPTGEGLELLGHFQRCVIEAAPQWFLLENVRKVPRIEVPGYTMQVLHVRASEFGAAQHRLRIFQFGYRDGMPLILRRPVAKPKATERATLASEGTKGKKGRGWERFCALAGFDTPPDLDSFHKRGKYQAVGNGVHRWVAHAVAAAILSRHLNKRPSTPDMFTTWELIEQPCACQCGRPVNGRLYAEAACRKRAERMRKRDPAEHNAPWKDTPPRDVATVTGPGPVTHVRTRPERPPLEWIERNLPC